MYKDKAKRMVDSAAEDARRRYVTAGDGQGLTYQEKAEEATDYVSNGYPADTSSYPFVEADAEIYGITPQEAADQILSQKSAWIAVSVQIEKIRLGAKKTIDEADSEGAVEASRDTAIAALRVL